jgi:hypothetical protein
MRSEHLATEKSHLAIALTPRSERMQYGLDLTRALTRRIQEVVEATGGRLVVFQVDTGDFTSDEDQIYVLNGKYYRVSKRQYEVNWKHVNTGFDVEIIPMTLRDWRVGTEDAHLNAHATDAAMAALAQRLRSRIPGSLPARTDR